MKKLGILLTIATILMVGCEGESKAFKASLQRQLAAQYEVPISDIQISFFQSCAISHNEDYSPDSIFYVKVGEKPTIYEYYASDCSEEQIAKYQTTVFSKDGKLPKSIETGAED